MFLDMLELLGVAVVGFLFVIVMMFGTTIVIALAKSLWRHVIKEKDRK